MTYRIRTLTDYQQAKLHAQDPEKFWGSIAENFSWHKKWSRVCSGDFVDINFKWFEGAELNITSNCIDRHLSDKADKVALIFEPNEPTEESRSYTYRQLHSEVCRFANVLKKHGVQKGDRVCLYMAMVPELLFATLACARIGAVHCVVFGGFSAVSLRGRIQDCGAKVVVTNDGGYRGKKLIELKAIVDEAVTDCPSIKSVIVVERARNSIQTRAGFDFHYQTEAHSVSDQCDAQIMQAEDPLFILYTSGSTGKPKGLLHTTAGYMVQVGYTFKNVFQMEQNDIFWCTADLGWITGHSYLTYGPLLNGQTTVMFEGIPTYPDAARFWNVIDRHRVTHFYTAPTAIRSLELAGEKFVQGHDLSSLKVLGSVGEPINEEAWHWYSKHIGRNRCPIVDTWWQTETGAIMISNLAGVTPAIAAHATLPLPGVQPALMDEQGKMILSQVAEGRLVLTRSWPSQARTIYGDHQRFKETYFSTFPGMYFTGDGARRDASNNYRITGRVDDIVIVSGHNIGTAEVEDAIDQHRDIVECAVVGYPHDIKGQAIAAFAIPHHQVKDVEKLKAEINQSVVKMVGAIARPEKVIIVTGLPKTRSGKIMRRILRKIASGETDFGDISTLLNPEIVEEIRHSFLNV
jgi:acetyl-CoA synthetase